MLRRMEWFRLHQHWIVDQWRRVVFSDESPFGVRCARRFRVWRRKTEKYHLDCIKATVKHQRKINVLGCFATHSVGRIIRYKASWSRNISTASSFTTRSRVAWSCFLMKTTFSSRIMTPSTPRRSTRLTSTGA